MERVAIEAVRVSRALSGEDLQHRGKAGYEGEVPGTLDKNAFRLRQRPRQPLGMIRHAGQIVVLGSIDEDGNRDLRQRSVGEGRRVRRHEHDGPYPWIAELGELADLAGRSPTGRAAVAANPGVVGMLPATRARSIATGSGTGDCQRGVATIRLAYHPDTFALDVRPERSVYKDRIDDAGYLLRAADPDADTRY